MRPYPMLCEGRQRRRGGRMQAVHALGGYLLPEDPISLMQHGLGLI